MTPPAWSRIAWDSCVLFGSSDRRFIMASCELAGGKTVVLPQVANELFGVLADDAAQYWLTTLKWEERRHGSRYSAATKARIAEAGAEGHKKWVRSEIDAQSSGTIPDDAPVSALSLLLQSAEERGKALEIAGDIPAHCFRGEPKHGHWGDRQVVAQAIVGGFRVLASRNRMSIKRSRINRWCREVQGLNGDLIQEADEVLQSMLDDMAIGQERKADIGPGDHFALKSVLLAAMPGRAVSPARLDEIVEGFIEGMERSKTFIDCADSALRAWRSSAAQGCIEEITPLLAESPARNTEQRRIDSMRHNAVKAGWRPGR